MLTIVLGNILYSFRKKFFLFLLLVLRPIYGLNIELYSIKLTNLLLHNKNLSGKSINNPIVYNFSIYSSL